MTRRNDSVKVRTVAGAVGGVDARLLLEPALWQRSVKLLAAAKAMPVQARGRTKVQTNLRVDPGRTQPRLYQFVRGVPVEVVARTVADWVQVSDERENREAQDSKKEDWFLVRGLATRPPGEASARSSESNTTTQPGDQTIPIAGWVVARFVELDLPEPVREGMASANVRPTAWFELNRVESPSGDKPQYLVAGTRDSGGVPCDFPRLRAYTWNPEATPFGNPFLANNHCGPMLVRDA